MIKKIDEQLAYLPYNDEKSATYIGMIAQQLDKQRLKINEIIDKINNKDENKITCIHQKVCVKFLYPKLGSSRFINILNGKQNNECDILTCSNFKCED